MSDKSRYIRGLSSTSWAEDIEESGSEHSDAEDLSDSGGGDAEMVSPSTSRRSGLPSGPPDPVTPTPKRSKGKKKRTSAAAELASPPPHAAPPVSCPGSSLSASADPFKLAPVPSPTPSSAASSVATQFAASTSRSTYGVLDTVSSLNDILSSWAGKSWEVERNTMHIARAVSITVCHVVNAGWHTLPFEDSPNSPTLASVLHNVLPQASPTLVPTHGSAESVAPGPSSKPRSPPSEATACPPLASKPAPPPRPARSAKCPPPPSTGVKRSYADTVRDITSLVNLAKMVPDLPSDCIIAMHQASVPLALPKRKIKSTVPGPSRRQVLVKINPLPSSFQFPAIVGSANRSLGKGDLRVDSCHFAYGGISLLTSRIASQAEIDLVSSSVQRLLSLAKGGVEASLSKSQSYLKIVDVPFFKVDGDQVTSADVRIVMGKSHLASSFTLANSPRVMRNSRRANTATMWFDVLDSQSGATAKCLINTSFQFGPSSAAGGGDTPLVPVVLRPPDAPGVLLRLEVHIYVILNKYFEPQYSTTRRTAPAPIKDDIDLVELAKAFPALPTDSIAAIHHTAHNVPAASKCKPTSTTLGPSCHQILILFSNPGDIDFFKLISQSNDNLKAKKSSLRILTTCIAYGGILLSTTTVPSADDLKVIADFISSGAKVTVTVSLPQSRSFLKIINVPFPVTPD
ncbi:hypothetical protein AN958_02593 [Leucoagaricus sp. SymC.cos]|nr:hypothetical protein AN958_02593 [Leucoagaricus sp. SymC.cos]